MNCGQKNILIGLFLLLFPTVCFATPTFDSVPETYPLSEPLPDYVPSTDPLAPVPSFAPSLAEQTSLSSVIEPVPVSPVEAGALAIHIEGDVSIVVRCAGSDWECQTRALCNFVAKAECTPNDSQTISGVDRGWSAVGSGAEAGRSFVVSYDPLKSYGGIFVCNSTDLRAGALEELRDICDVRLWYGDGTTPLFPVVSPASAGASVAQPPESARPPFLSSSELSDPTQYQIDEPFRNDLTTLPLPPIEMSAFLTVAASSRDDAALNPRERVDPAREVDSLETRRKLFAEIAKIAASTVLSDREKKYLIELLLMRINEPPIDTQEDHPSAAATSN